MSSSAPNPGLVESLEQATLIPTEEPPNQGDGLLP